MSSQSQGQLGLQEKNQVAWALETCLKKVGNVFGWELQQIIAFPLWACQGLAVSHMAILVPAFCEVLIIENCHFYVPVVCLSEATSWGSHGEAAVLL